MSLHFPDVETEYANNKDLKQKEVKKFMDWVNQQPHLPKINEFQAMLFLHACYYDEDAAKKVIDVHFTVKTSHPDIFKMRNPHKSPIREDLDVAIISPLAKKTPEGYTIIYIKLMDVNPKNLNMVTQLKIFDMVCMSITHQSSISEGYVAVLDMQGVVFRHLFCLAPLALKTYLYYVAEGIPGRVMRIHLVNTVPFIINKILALIKPFLSEELYDMIHIHSTVDDVLEFIPLECLPEDYGGSCEAVAVLHGVVCIEEKDIDYKHLLVEKSKQKILDNREFFEWEDEQVVDESLRPGRKHNWFKWS